MPYKVMALKWRPRTFEEVIGQEHVTRTLQNAIRSDRIGHAYLFSGPRGVGKTTVARILAKALNCKEGPTPTPCNQCPLCTEVTEDRSLDVLEIDGASHTGVEHIRKLKERVGYAPAHGRYRIFIIDEVHMLSDSAFNALLKTLEEPPAHVIFIFATTQPIKVPITIQSRCQCFDFRRLTSNQIIKRLTYIIEHDKLEVDLDALTVIARRAEGSMRDGQSLLEQVISYGGERITEELTSEALGLASRDVFFQLLEAVQDRNSKDVLDLVATVEEQGWDVKDFVDGLLDHLRHLLLAKIDPQSSELAGLSKTVGEQLRKQADQAEEEDLLRMISLISDVEKDLKYARRPRFLLEMLAVKLTKMDTTVQIKELMQKLDRALGGKRTREEKPAAPEPTIRMEPESPPPADPSTQQETPRKPAAAQPAPPLPDPEGQTQDLWDQMVDRVTKKKSSLGALLLHGQLGNLQEKSMTIAFPKSCNFHRERAQREREVIEGEASAILGKDVRIKFTLADLPEPQARNMPTMEAPTKKLSVEEVVKTEPIVRMILDKMNGELME